MLFFVKYKIESSLEKLKNYISSETNFYNWIKDSQSYIIYDTKYHPVDIVISTEFNFHYAI